MLNHNELVTTEVLLSMRGAVAKVVAVAQPQEIDDLVSAALVKALDGGFDASRASFKTYASQIAYNEACNFMKAHANHGHVSHTVATDDAKSEPIVDTLIGEDGRAHALRMEQAQWLEMALATLSDDERTFILAINQDMTQTEAGALVGWSPATSTRRRKEIAAKLSALL